MNKDQERAILERHLGAKAKWKIRMANQRAAEDQRQARKLAIQQRFPEHPLLLQEYNLLRQGDVKNNNNNNNKPPLGSLKVVELLAHKYGCSFTYMYKKLNLPKGEQRTPTPTELLKHISNHMTIKQIAEQYGCSLAAVYNKKRRLFENPVRLQKVQEASASASATNTNIPKIISNTNK